MFVSLFSLPPHEVRGERKEKRPNWRFAMNDWLTWIDENLGFTTSEPIWNKIDLHSVIIEDDNEYYFPDSSMWI